MPDGQNVVVSVPSAPLGHTSMPNKQVNNIKTISENGPKPSDIVVEKIVFNIPIYKIIDQDCPFISFPTQKMGMENGRVEPN